MRALMRACVRACVRVPGARSVPSHVRLEPDLLLAKPGHALDLGLEPVLGPVVLLVLVTARLANGLLDRDGGSATACVVATHTRMEAWVAAPRLGLRLGLR